MTFSWTNNRKPKYLCYWNNLNNAPSKRRENWLPRPSSTRNLQLKYDSVRRVLFCTLANRRWLMADVGNLSLSLSLPPPLSLPLTHVHARSSYVLLRWMWVNSLLSAPCSNAPETMAYPIAFAVSWAMTDTIMCLYQCPQARVKF